MLEKNLLCYIVRNAELMPETTALREKQYGVWKPMTWRELHDNVQYFALGLRALGFAEGETLCIIGDNKPEWIIAEFATMAAGGTPTGTYADSMAEEMEYMITYSEARFLVCQDQEQVDKMLKIWDRIKSGVSKIICWDSRGMSHYYREHPFLERFEKVLATGKQEEEAGQKEFLKKRSEEIDESRPAVMLTTSGTTANPKLSILSHGNLIWACDSISKVIAMEKGDEILSLAPLPWIGEQGYNITRFLMVGAIYNFPEEAETLRRDLLELQPYYFGGTPVVWELLISTIQAAMDNADPVKRSFYKRAMEVAHKKVDAELAGEKTGAWGGFIYSLLHFFVLRPLKNRIGLGRVKIAFTGGGAISPEVFKYFKALQIDLRQVYGQTECTGIAATHYEGDVRPETVGVPTPGVEVKLSGDGEILVKGGNLHQGYYKNEQATKESFTEDGYLRTGDTGYFGEDGHLYVMDRSKDIMTLLDGTRFAPQDIETRMKFSPYIYEAMVIGNEKPYVAAIVSIDLENVGNWAKRRNMSFTTVQDLSQRTEVYELIREELRKLCQRFPENIRIKRFGILLKVLHADDGELTRTRKVRRKFVNERYQALIQDLYESMDAHNLDVEIRYEDGRVSALKGPVRLEEVLYS